MRHCVLLFVLASCDRPSPLGTFTRDDLIKWKADCATQIIEEDPLDPPVMALWEDRDRPRFERATRRFRCPPPGWAIYTDKRDRVIGFCVDDDVQLPNYRSDDILSPVDRARPLITAHWGLKLAAEMLKGAPERYPNCEYGRGVPVAGNMLRFGEHQLPYSNPETIHSQFMCCWKVTE